MPIELNNQDINADILQFDDTLFLAAVAGTVAEEQGFPFPITTAEDLQRTLQGVHDLIVPEVDDCISRELIERWIDPVVNLVLPIGSPGEFSRAVLLKMRAWNLLQIQTSRLSPNLSPNFIIPPRR
jgi:hypothetical protein